jgi:hypothetical protein
MLGSRRGKPENTTQANLSIYSNNDDAIMDAVAHGQSLFESISNLLEVSESVSAMFRKEN